MGRTRPKSSGEGSRFESLGTLSPHLPSAGGCCIPLPCDSGARRSGDWASVKRRNQRFPRSCAVASRDNAPAGIWTGVSARRKPSVRT